MANQILQVFGTPLVFQDSGGSAVLVFASVAAAAGRISAQLDRGAAAIATRYMLKAKFEKTTAATVGQVFGVYIARGDGTHVEGSVGTASAALTQAQANGLMYVGSVYINSTGTSFVGFFDVEINTRYISVGYINSTTIALSATANLSTISLIPVIDEIQ